MDEDDVVALQNDVLAMQHWGSTWGMNFNATKCNAITFGRIAVKNPPNYMILDSEIEKVHEVKDLGIIIDDKLKWDIHIRATTKKSFNTLWVLIRNLGYDSPFNMKKIAYMSMVRSQLEYGSCLWNPNVKELIEEVERVQRKATNFIVRNNGRLHPNFKSYKQRLQECNLLPLSYRREILEVIFFLKSYHGMTGFNIRDYVAFVDEGDRRLTRETYEGSKLRVLIRYRLQLLYYAYPSRIVRIWNSLPPHLRTSLRTVSESLVIKQLINPYYYAMRDTRFNVDDTCTWINFCRCQKCLVV